MDTLATDTASKLSDSANVLLDTSMAGMSMTTPMHCASCMPGMGVIAGIIGAVLVLVAFYIVVGWKIFQKAGKPGWASIVPIYNIVVFLEITGRPIWWIVLMLLPIVSLVVSIVLMVDLARKFGKGVGFAIGLILLGFIFAPILAFGSAKYDPKA